MWLFWQIQGQVRPTDRQTIYRYIYSTNLRRGDNALLHKNLKSLLGCTVERGNNRLGMKSFSIDCVCSMYMYCMCVCVCTCLPIEINRVRDERSLVSWQRVLTYRVLSWPCLSLYNPNIKLKRWFQGSLICWKQRPEVIGPGISKWIWISPDRWSCTRLWLPTKSSENCDCMVALWFNIRLLATQKPISPPATTLLPAERGFSVRSRHQAGRYSLRFLNPRSQLTFGYLLRKKEIVLHYSSSRWFVFFSVSWMLFSLCTSLPRRSSIHPGPTSDCYCVLCI